MSIQPVAARAHPGVPGERTGVPFDQPQRGVADLAAGRMIVVVDDEDRENEGDIVLAAEMATAANVGFMVRHTSGVLCVPMEERRADALHLPPMTPVNEDSKGTAYTVSVDAADGIGTGISAADRAHTIRTLAGRATDPADLNRPGHVFPLRAVEHGVLRRPGHTEAAVDLARLAGLSPACVIGEIVRDDGSVASLPELTTFARQHGMAIVSIADLVEHRRRTERTLTRHAEADLPTRYGSFRAVGYQDAVSGTEHVALTYGDPAGDGVLVRVHSECLTGDAFGSLRCDCGDQFDAALAAIAHEGRGALVYLRDHEGRGIGLTQKLRAYQLQDAGADTVDANVTLGLPVDARDYAPATQILADLGTRTVRLLSNNPAKEAGLSERGIGVVSRQPLHTARTEYNIRYLRTKRDRLHHHLAGLDLDPATPDRCAHP
ncbi:bifunctional 3,4-dihydroxy-2-butanone-4-phosphate synthase/GTP cyclohydrolase II [Haloechinothrix sp. YIM 98757]|uniref:Riboflavin biosynthesis protein RibBA n=1 Tax=Haloechinothrix aidingensis TaxID=2752311 RepID=A0A838ABG2_9PSEU|nr:bifunctional 3,4-dihydroxy-2-butanone-4-phosphate synthase/GTP cyclohydrolase II [Haloechinothrix aidingensis]MBA0126571.1 bifunctional 3,4-dihydroxy-2-butanone-4-phosphate synthase/GTP cyclohydrolase II [Haloechinothrix aidingensis]